MKKRLGMEKQLFEDTKKRFQQICEYTIMGNTVDEANNEPQPQQPDMPQEQPAENPASAQQAPPPMPPQADPSMMPQMPPQGQADTTSGFNPQVPDMPQEQPAEAPTEDDNVVDITDITDAQEETSEHVESLDNKFGMIMKKMSDFENLIKDNDNKINDLKAEFEKRNPTQVEKQAFNTEKGGPFNVTPEEYWEKKDGSNREIERNGEKEFIITPNDIKGATDWRSIANSLDDDFIFNQTLENALKF